MESPQDTQDTQDAIGGWGSKTVGMGYGKGYRLEHLKGYLEKYGVRRGAMGSAVTCVARPSATWDVSDTSAMPGPL